jgi:hypothetical protein
MRQKTLFCPVWRSALAVLQQVKMDSDLQVRQTSACIFLVVKCRRTLLGSPSEIVSYHIAVEGESPPFHVPTLGKAFFRATSKGGNEAAGASQGMHTSPSLKMITQKVIAMQRRERAEMKHNRRASATNFGSGKGHHHRRALTLLDTIGHESHRNEAEDAFGLHHAGGFRDFRNVFDVDPNETSGDDDDDVNHMMGTDPSESGSDDQSPHEGLPLLSGNSSGLQSTLSERQIRARQLLVQSQLKRVKEFLNPAKLVRSFFHWFICSALMLAIPLFVTAWILFYYCGNPLPPEFFPGSATVSWCESVDQGFFSSGF